MEFTQYVRKPFQIEAAEITEENMAEVCELIGHEVKSNAKGSFIVLNRRIVPNGYRAFPGWFITRMIGPKGQENLRCYPPRVFHSQFTPMNDDWAPWFEEKENESSTSSEDTEWIPVEPLAEDDSVQSNT